MPKDTEAEESVGNLALRRGIYYQAFGIYKEVGGFFDYGPIGLRIKRNVESAWRKLFIEGTGSLEIESTLIMPEAVFKASGHLASFTDPIMTCLKCKQPSRADKLLEEHYHDKGDEKAAKGVEKLSLDGLNSAIKENRIKCPNCGGEFGKVEDFNMMFKTQIGSLGGEMGYLRPETAQGIFVDFINLFRIYGMRLPCGIGQAGKVFRNEISPRQHLVRLREFSQMELEIFFDPKAEQKEYNGILLEESDRTKVSFVGKGSDAAEEKTIGVLIKEGKIPNRLFGLLLYLESRLLDEIGIQKDHYRFRAIENPPHYSGGNVDIEINTSYGYIEIAGNAYRTDYDLSSHSKVSGKDLSVVGDNGKVMPHVVEASIGIDRLLFALLDNSTVKDKERGWDWLKLNRNAAPYAYAVFPLQKDDKLVTFARKISKDLTGKGVTNFYSESGSIGKRYAKADEVGIPNAITVDFQTIDDGTVTIRDRNTAKQVRKKAGEIE